MSLHLKGDGVHFEEEIKDAINEAEIYRYWSRSVSPQSMQVKKNSSGPTKQKDGLEGEHDKRSKDVVLSQLPHRHLLLVHLGVEGPVSGGVAQLLGLFVEETLLHCLWDDQEAEDAECAAQNQSQPLRGLAGWGKTQRYTKASPLSSAIQENSALQNLLRSVRPRADNEVRRRALDCEAAEENSPNKCSTDKATQGHATIYRIPYIGQRTAQDGQRRGAEEAAEEATDKDGLEILRQSNGDLEDDKAEVTKQQRWPAAVQLAERAKDNRPKGEAEHVERDAERHDLCGDAIDARSRFGGGAEDAGPKSYSHCHERHDEGDCKLSQKGEV